MIPVLQRGVQSSQVVQVFFPPFALIINYLSMCISSVVQDQETLQDSIPNTWQGSTDDTMKPKKAEPNQYVNLAKSQDEDTKRGIAVNRILSSIKILTVILWWHATC